jgi:predicted Zn-dependent peptidase
MAKNDGKEIRTFSNGLRFALKHSNSQVAYCALSIRCGTSVEPEALSGLAHLTEHMLFKGTSRRSSASINDRLERLGGELNAYTTKEEIVIYATTLKEDVLKAIDLLFELAFDPAFSPKELEKEKGVVVDEINLYKDSPSDYIFDDFEKYLYEGSPISRHILGTAKSLKRITSDDLRDFTKACFLPCNMSFSVVGDFSFPKLADAVEKHMLKYAPEDSGATPVTTPDVKVNVFRRDENKKHHQSNCIIGAPAYSLFDKRRIALVLLMNILGGPSCNSRLNSLLRERKALVYNVEASYTPYSRTGCALIYFGCEKENVDKCVALVLGELAKIRNTPLSGTALRYAKKQLLAQNAISSENGEAQALAIGRSLLNFGDYMSDAQIRNLVEALTSEDLQAVASDVFAEDKLSFLIYR